VKLLLSDNEREQSFLEYFENTYIFSKPAIRLRADVLNLNDTLPYYQLTCGQSSRVDENLPRTTNIAESWHSRLNR
jgi:hypothetical protein